MPLQLPPGSLYGETLRSHKVSGFELSERVYPARFRTPQHSHKQALFCYVVQGNYTEHQRAGARMQPVGAALPSGERNAFGAFPRFGRAILHHRDRS